MNEDTLYEKVYVDVLVKMAQDGRINPIRVIWQDGRCYEVDNVTEIRRAPARFVGGWGIRYTCRIHGKPRELYLEDNKKWFVEKRVI